MEENVEKIDEIKKFKGKRSKYFLLCIFFVLVVCFLSIAYLLKENYILKTENKSLLVKISNIEDKNYYLEGNNIELKNRVDEIVVLKQKTEKMLGLLDTDMDTSNWIEYQSDTYGYRLKIPESYVFLPEGSRDLPEFSPESTSFFVGTTKQEGWQYLLYYYIIEDSIDLFIEKVEKETKGKDSYKKIFSKNDFDFYQRTGASKDSMSNIIVYNNSLGMHFSYEEEVYDEKEFWAIISTVRLIN